MKTDYHCHILPGIDDGAKGIEESVFLAQKLVEWGYNRAICTPHSSYSFHNTPSTVLPVYTALVNALAERGVCLELFPSMEYRIIPEVWNDWRKNHLLLEPWKGKHLLIEFPIRGREFFKGLDPIKEVKWLISKGYIPVLAHPERYKYMKMEELNGFLDLGCEFQMNYGSLYGFYDDETRQRAELIQSRGWYNYTGTDLHNRTQADFLDNIINGQNDGTHLLRVALDWGYDEDPSKKYKFGIKRTEHGFNVGMSVLLNVWGWPSSPVRATIIDVQDDGFIVQADDYVDICEEYNIKKI